MATTSTDPVVRAGDELWTVDDVAAYFRVTTRTVREWRTLDAILFRAVGSARPVGALVRP